MVNVTCESLDYYLNLKYAFSVYPEETGVYTIMIPELPGCMSQGKSIEEAFQNLEKARQYWITRAWDSGNEIPIPISTNTFKTNSSTSSSQDLIRHKAS